MYRIQGEKSMSKVVLSGFYGFHNIGDEAILLTLTEKLRSEDPEVDITVLSNNPEETQKKFNVKAVDRHNPFKVVMAIMMCDTLISGGGSLLQDVTSARSIHYYLFIIRAGLFFRKRVVLLSHGIGPLNSEKNRKRVSKTLNKVLAVSVRDQNSYDLLCEIGVDPSKITLSADPVMAMGKAGKALGQSILKQIGLKETGRKNVGIAIRQKDFRERERQVKLVKLANDLAKEYNVVFLPFYYKNDTKIAGDIATQMDEHVYFVTEKYHSKDFMSLVENMDILVGSRLHSLIFSVVAEVPFVGVSYDPKIENFLEMLDKEPVCDILHFDDAKVNRAVHQVERDYDKEKALILENKAMLEERLMANDALFHLIL